MNVREQLFHSRARVEAELKSQPGWLSLSATPLLPHTLYFVGAFTQLRPFCKEKLGPCPWGPASLGEDLPVAALTSWSRGQLSRKSALPHKTAGTRWTEKPGYHLDSISG